MFPVLKICWTAQSKLSEDINVHQNKQWSLKMVTYVFWKFCRILNFMLWPNSKRHVLNFFQIQLWVFDESANHPFLNIIWNKNTKSIHKTHKENYNILCFIDVLQVFHHKQKTVSKFEILHKQFNYLFFVHKFLKWKTASYCLKISQSFQFNASWYVIILKKWDTTPGHHVSLMFYLKIGIVFFSV